MPGVFILMTNEDLHGFDFFTGGDLVGDLVGWSTSDCIRDRFRLHNCEFDLRLVMTISFKLDLVTC